MCLTIRRRMRSSEERSLHVRRLSGLSRSPCCALDPDGGISRLGRIVLGLTKMWSTRGSCCSSGEVERGEILQLARERVGDLVGISRPVARAAAWTTRIYCEGGRGPPGGRAEPRIESPPPARSPPSGTKHRKSVGAPHSERLNQLTAAPRHAGAPDCDARQ